VASRLVRPIGLDALAMLSFGSDVRGRDFARPRRLAKYSLTGRFCQGFSGNSPGLSHLILGATREQAGEEAVVPPGPLQLAFH
jgi:hypothetical protein